MPKRRQRTGVCAQPGCAALTQRTWCLAHEPANAKPWAGSTRRATLPPGWPIIRARILDRDGHRCTWVEDGQRCVAVATEVDHVNDREDHGDGNLRSLCEPHHAQRTAAQANEARWHRGGRPPTPVDR